MNHSLRVFALLALVAVFTLLPQTSNTDEHKAILITGASTGIGRHLAESLAADGHHVYAGARKDKDLAELDAIENITAVRLDVTKQDQIDAAVEKVKADGGGLYALVNNAGVGGGDFVADTPIDDQSF